AGAYACGTSGSACRHSSRFRNHGSWRRLMYTPVDKLVPAFDDAVQESQQVFRRALAALSEPGTVQTVPFSRQLEHIDPAGYALCLTLLDEYSPLWLSHKLDSPGLRHNLMFHSG